MSISGIIRSGVFSLLCICATSMNGNAVIKTDEASFESMIDQIKANIENVVHVVSPRYDASVESYLRTYIERGREKTEMMLGRSTLYFPMFEQELEASGLPTDLKYLAVVESALTPQAVSPVGAAGLWQFMRPTARECGLSVTRYVDERCDPVKATRAAIKYLTFLYDQFDSWELAMAAYNSGPGRVRYAIRKSGSKDYWKLQRYLPRETRSYVPGFIAASYILNYYNDHDLIPAYPSADLTQTESVQIFDGISFSEISSVTGVPQDILAQLNPTFVRKYIPQSSTGYLLVLPAMVATTMRAYLSQDSGDAADLATFEGIETGYDMQYVDRLVEETYIVHSGDNLYNISRAHRCTVDDLKSWNRLSGNTIHIGQRLKIKKMTKVLIKVPVLQAPVVREQIEVPVIPVVAVVTDLGRTFRQLHGSSDVAPVLKTPRTFATDQMVLRRRMVLSEVGMTAAEDGILTPGTALQPIAPALSEN